MFPKIGVPPNGWFIKENPIKMDDLGVPLFSETSICEPSLAPEFCPIVFGLLDFPLVHVHHLTRDSQRDPAKSFADRRDVD